MQYIKEVKKWICALYGDKSENEILNFFSVPGFSYLQVRDSSPTTWMIEKKKYNSWIPTDETAIDMCDEDTDFGIVEV